MTEAFILSLILTKALLMFHHHYPSFRKLKTYFIFESGTILRFPHHLDVKIKSFHIKLLRCFLFTESLSLSIKT